MAGRVVARMGLSARRAAPTFRPLVMTSVRPASQYVAALAKSQVEAALLEKELRQMETINSATTDIADGATIVASDCIPPVAGPLALDLSAFERADEMDPFSLVADDVGGLSATIRELLGVDHPVLATVARYFFEKDGGKKIRPALVIMLSRAANLLLEEGGNTDRLLPAQRRLADIVEMMHTATLLHDDVIDEAEVRRGVASINQVFGNKVAVLGGDFMLARASVLLSRLRDPPVVELLSTVIEHLVQGEVLQMANTLENGTGPQAAFEIYMRKTFYKTASLIASSCRASAMLSGQAPEVEEACFRFGKHIGLAFQLVDDLLDLEGTAETLGKPSGNDLKQGLATAPLLFAVETHPELIPMIQRKFQGQEDVARALNIVQETDGLQRTRQLAVYHGQKAIDAIAILPPSDFRTALASMARLILDRKR